MDDNRIISGNKREEDVLIDRTLRPQRLEYYIGQQKVKEKLSIFIEAAREGESWIGASCATWTG